MSTVDEVRERYAEAFGRSVKYCRERRGVSQKRLAETIGVRCNTISHLENARHSPGADVVLAVVLALRIKPCVLADLVRISRGGIGVAEK
jgi:transcriptional regulator with XRE-family HTH domain